MTLTINLALDGTNHAKELERFSEEFKNNLELNNNINVNTREKSSAFRLEFVSSISPGPFNDILLKGNSILEMQNRLLRTENFLSASVIDRVPNIFNNSAENFMRLNDDLNKHDLKMEEGNIKWKQ